MGKDKPHDPEKAARKAEKKAKKEAAAKTTATTTTTNGASTSRAPPAPTASTTTTSSSSKKEKAARAKAIEAEIANVDAQTKLLDQLDETAPGTVVVKKTRAGDDDDDDDYEEEGTKNETKNLQVRMKAAPLLGALVPFANPLADEKVAKKVLKGVKKGSPVPQITFYFNFPCSLCHLTQSPISVRLHAHQNESKFAATKPQANNNYFFPLSSEQIPRPETRRQRSRQSPAEIPNQHKHHHHNHQPNRNRNPRRRHIPNGRNIPPARPLRRPPHTLHIRIQSCRTRCCKYDQETD